MIQYLDGKVRVLQTGVFVNGNLEGISSVNGDNWEIVWNGVNACNYYRGDFNCGEKVGDEFTETNISMSRINDLISNIEFDFTDLWMIEDEAL